MAESRALRVGKAAPAYGSGRSTSLRSGYVRVRRVGHPLAGVDGYVYEHRLVWFEAHGAIAPGMHVHHIDGDRANNDLANLELVSNSDHQRTHHSVPGTLRRNQHGAFPIRVPTERVERERRRSREAASRRRSARREALPCLPG